jgi:hypothetical protein
MSQPSGDQSGMASSATRAGVRPGSAASTRTRIDAPNECPTATPPHGNADSSERITPAQPPKVMSSSGSRGMSTATPSVSASLSPIRWSSW